MKTASNIFLVIGTAACIALGLFSCEYKNIDDVVYSPNTVLLDFSYEKIDSVPESFRVAFYPADEETNAKISQGYVIFDVLNTQTTLSELPAGKYRVSAWNNDTEYNTIENLGVRNSLMAATPTYYATSATPSTILDSIYNGMKIYDCPDYMVHANEDLFEIEMNKQNQTLILHPDSMVVKVEVRIHGVAGLQICKQIKGTMNNVAKKRFIAYDNALKDSTVVMFSCNFNPADSLIFSDIFIYGLYNDSLSPTNLTLFLWLEGKNIFLPIDLKEAVANYRKNDSKLIIEIDDLGIDLRNFVSNAGGFDVDINDWDDMVEIEIPW